MSQYKAPNTDLHHMFHFKFDAELLEVGVFQLFRNLGRNMLSLALPFYLFSSLEYEIWQVCLFYLTWQICFVCLYPFAGFFLEKWGLKPRHSLRVAFLPAKSCWYD